MPKCPTNPKTRGFVASKPLLSRTIPSSTNPNPAICVLPTIRTAFHRGSNATARFTTSKRVNHPNRIRTVKGETSQGQWVIKPAGTSIRPTKTVMGRIRSSRLEARVASEKPVRSGHLNPRSSVAVSGDPERLRALASESVSPGRREDPALGSRTGSGSSGICNPRIRAMSRMNGPAIFSIGPEYWSSIRLPYRSTMRNT